MNKKADDCFIDTLLISLQDERIIEKINEIIEADTFNQPRETKRLLKEKEEEIARFQQELDSKEREIIDYKIKINELNQKIDSYLYELQKRRADYQEAEELYNSIQHLSEETRNSLKRIFKGTTVQDFIFCGVQYENISSLWDFIKNEAMEGRGHERETLIAIFRYFFQAYSKTFDTPLYKTQEVQINDVFREDLHIRASDSKISGNITEILLPGYISINGKIIKKSIVKI
ncbi:hypothetical protein AWH48_13495 [Domibacillus aminovorans]|uniref:Uncharacterized protein n=1 Tax=Domibacillus aminovorans TaxID=29332 RepID=A0A177KJQ8_9BACI|nr:hypothetical protein [Domibacillus aminovorans]OAH52821.1 hypothetical protein AWH48_13495 [Domibacillus aminovorans]